MRSTRLYFLKDMLLNQRILTDDFCLLGKAENTN